MKIILTFKGIGKVVIDEDGTLHTESETLRCLVEIYKKDFPENISLPHPWEPMADELLRDCLATHKEIVLPDEDLVKLL